MTFRALTKAELDVLCTEASPFGLSISYPGVGVPLFHSRRKPAPKKPKDLARCEMMNRNLRKIIFHRLRSNDRFHPWIHLHHRILASIEQKTKTAV